jgi:hypothetical protein
MSSLLSYIPLPIFQESSTSSSTSASSTSLTTPTKETPSSSSSTPSLSPVPITINNDNPWIPTFEWRDLPQGQSIQYSGLEINLSTRQARIPIEGLQLTFIIPCFDHRTVRISVNREDNISDVCKYIANEWPGLRGRGFCSPNPNAIALKYNDSNTNTSKYLGNDQTIEAANLYFFQRNIVVTVFNSIDNNVEIDDWMYYAKNIYQHDDTDSVNDGSNSISHSDSTIPQTAACTDLVLVNVDIDNDSSNVTNDNNGINDNNDSNTKELTSVAPPIVDPPINEQDVRQDNNKKIQKSFLQQLLSCWK